MPWGGLKAAAHCVAGIGLDFIPGIAAEKGGPYPHFHCLFDEQAAVPGVARQVYHVRTMFLNCFDVAGKVGSVAPVTDLRQDFSARLFEGPAEKLAKHRAVVFIDGGGDNRRPGLKIGVGKFRHGEPLERIDEAGPENIFFPFGDFGVGRSRADHRDTGFFQDRRHRQGMRTPVGADDRRHVLFHAFTGGHGRADRCAEVVEEEQLHRLAEEPACLVDLSDSKFGHLDQRLVVGSGDPRFGEDCRYLDLVCIGIAGSPLRQAQERQQPGQQRQQPEQAGERAQQTRAERAGPACRFCHGWNSFRNEPHNPRNAAWRPRSGRSSTGSIKFL